MRYQTFLRKSTYRRYWIFVLTIFFSYYSIQAFINNKTIDLSITEVKEQNLRINEEIAFKNNFYQNYLRWEYSNYFLWHENWQLYQGERLLRIKQRLTPNDAIILQPNNLEGQDEQIQTPQESWRHFIRNRLPQLRFLNL